METTSAPEKVHIHSIRAPAAQAPIDHAWLRKLCLDSGADDAGFAHIDDPALAAERPHVLAAFPHTRSLVSLVIRTNRDNIRSPARSVANLEFHQATDELNAIARRITTALERAGIRALNPAVGFPMEASKWMTGRMWVVSHKPVAVAAGLGHMGIHRCVIHPRFGSFILLATILVGAEVGAYGRQLDYNPCLTCKLCVAACPVGALGADGAFNFSACTTHNYKEFMGGFTNWVEDIAESRGKLDYRRRVPEHETVSTWQSLSFGPNYKAAYCISVCPAGEEVIGPFRLSRKAFTEDVVRPLQAKVEDLYVIQGSDAETHARRRFPHKRIRHVRNPLRPRNIATFLQGLPLAFQRGAAGSLRARYHFRFTGEEKADVTVRIHDGKLDVSPGLEGTPDIRVTADGGTWLGFLAGERGLPWALLTGRIRLKGDPRWLLAFRKCFPV